MEIRIEFFSQQIRHLREEHQLTQEALAHQLGVSRQSIIALERGRCLPSLPLALSMANLFDLALENIFLPTRQEIIPSVPVQVLENEENWQLNIALPKNIDTENIEAQISDGNLTVILPKMGPKVTKIKVKKI